MEYVMDWSKGIEARYYASVVDRNTWRDIEKFDITGGTISRSLGELVESADIDCVNYSRGEQWIRVWLDARQNGASEHIPMFTGLATSPADNFNGNLITNTLECYSVLKPCQDVLLPRGWYASGAGKYVLDDLLSVTPAPVVIDGEMPNLQKPIIAEQGETHLSMINKILLAIDWRIRITGDGTITVCPQAKQPSGEFGLGNDIIEPVLSRSYDWYQCPNVFRATNGDDSAVAVDDSEDSILSTKSRGREIWAEDTSANLSDTETLYEYASRRLKESQMVAQTLSYDRRYNPNIVVGDLVRILYPNIAGLYYVSSQRIEIGYGAKTTEEIVR